VVVLCIAIERLTIPKNTKSVASPLDALVPVCDRALSLENAGADNIQSLFGIASTGRVLEAIREYVVGAKE
jgi:hypothetical protein